MQGQPRATGVTIGKFFGIETRLHWSFLLVLVLLFVVGAVGNGLPAALTTVTLFVAIFGCVLLHELGHALAARRYGIGTKEILLLPIGGLAQLERIPSNPRQELVIAVAGPLVNVAIVALLLPVSMVSQASFVATLIQVNVILVIFNLLPAFPMDGGRILRAILAFRMSAARATRIASSIGRAFAVLFAIAGWFINPFLILIAAFVWMAGRQETAFVEEREALGTTRVDDAMQIDFFELDASEPVNMALLKSVRSGQSLFPVYEGTAWTGVFDASSIDLTAFANRPDIPVGRFVDADALAVAPSDSLREVSMLLRSRSKVAAVVVEANRPIGIISLPAIQRFRTLSRARRSGSSVNAGTQRATPQTV